MALSRVALLESVDFGRNPFFVKTTSRYTLQAQYKRRARDNKAIKRLLFRGDPLISELQITQI